MFGVLVTSHGPLCKALVETGEMIAGVMENVEYISLDEKGVDVYSCQLKEKLDKMAEKYEGVIILCDLKGGTPFNECLKIALTEEYNSAIIAGVNLPVYLETVHCSIHFSKDFEELFENLKETTKETIEFLSFKKEE